MKKENRKRKKEKKNGRDLEEEFCGGFGKFVGCGFKPWKSFVLEFCRLRLIGDLSPEFYRLVVVEWCGDEGLFGYKSR